MSTQTSPKKIYLNKNSVTGADYLCAETSTNVQKCAELKTVKGTPTAICPPNGTALRNWMVQNSDGSVTYYEDVADGNCGVSFTRSFVVYSGASTIVNDGPLVIPTNVPLYTRWFSKIGVLTKLSTETNSSTWLLETPLTFSVSLVHRKLGPGDPVSNSVPSSYRYVYLPNRLPVNYLPYVTAGDTADTNSNPDHSREEYSKGFYGSASEEYTSTAIPPFNEPYVASVPVYSPTVLSYKLVSLHSKGWSDSDHDAVHFATFYNVPSTATASSSSNLREKGNPTSGDVHMARLTSEAGWNPYTGIVERYSIFDNFECNPGTRLWVKLAKTYDGVSSAYVEITATVLAKLSIKSSTLIT